MAAPGSATRRTPSIALLEAEFGKPWVDTTDYYPPSFYPNGRLPYRRYTCFTDGPCVISEGATFALAFTGWSASSRRLLDENGLGPGSRGSDLPGAITSLDKITAGVHLCVPNLAGEAASGIHLGLMFDGRNQLRSRQSPPPKAK